MNLAEGSDEFTLPVTDDGIVRIVPRLRERYLTPDVGIAVVQAAGTHLQIWLWSDRENIVVGLPLEGFRWERPYTRSLHKWGINVARWLTPGKHDDSEETLMWHNHGALDVGYGGETGKPMIEATVATFDGGMPDVV